MRRVPHAVVLTAVITALAASGAAAQTPGTSPGVIAADSALYPVDVQFDELLVSIDAKPPGAVVHERASEALIAQEANDTAARDRALTDMQRVAEVANGMEDGDGLQKAEAVLEEVTNRAPAEAQTGLETALDSVIKAQNRDINDTVPETVPDTIPDTPGGEAL